MGSVAVRSQHIDTGKKGFLIEATDKDNNTPLHAPLHLALKGGYTRIAVLIISQLKGSQIQAMDKNGNSPLHLAAQRGHGGLVYLLLGRRASFSAVNKSGQRPYSLAPDQGTRWNFWQYGVHS